MRTERLLGWCGLLLIGLIGVAYRLYDRALGVPLDRELGRKHPSMPYDGR